MQAEEDMDDEFPVVHLNETDEFPVPFNLTDKPVTTIDWVTKGYVTPVINVRLKKVIHSFYIIFQLIYYIKY